MLFNESRAEEILARAGVDALVATSPDNVMYATDYECVSHWGNKGFQVYSIFTPGRDPRATLVAPSLELEALVEGDVWVEDVILFGHFPRGPADPHDMDEVGTAGKAVMDRATTVAKALDGLAAAIESRGLDGGRIAVDETGITPMLFRQLQVRLPNATLVAGNPLWWEIRMVKTPEEVRRLREASRITEAAVRAAYRLARPGARERDIVHEYYRQIADMVGRPTFMLLGSGSRSGYPHPLASDKVIEEGDVLRHDVGCTFDYYHADTARAVVMGTPTSVQLEIWDALCRGVEEATALVRPGADVRELYRAAMRPGKELGLANFDRFHCGHGMGISIYDPPLVTLADPSESAFLMPSVEGGLEPGMILNLEVGYYIQGVQGFLCEDTMLVTETGYDRLTHNSKALAYDAFTAGEDS